MQFSILMKNEGNGHLAVRQTRKMRGNQNFQLALINIICFKIKNLPPVELCWQQNRNP
jgi:hypothetical protein